jgi:ABC-type nitrate/sulfonate/bicarbonate transport system substrate-binding protein
MFTAKLIGAEAPALRGVHNALGGTVAPVFVAQELGLFTKHGLEHSLQYIAATTAVQALAAGSEEIGLVGSVGVALEGAIPSTSPPPRRALFFNSTAIWRSRPSPD